ncbi:MAG: protein kinase [Phycisphaerales bacterium]
MNEGERFNLKPGRVIGGKYVVEDFLGAGTEGEVYRVRERRTDLLRAAKIFYPSRNQRDRAVKFYARKLERLRGCRLVIQYHHSETVRLKRGDATALISEYVEGELLGRFAAGHRGGRLPVFEALVLLREMAAGLAEIHERREYHGDLHAGNIIVSRRGVHFNVKLVDLHDHGRSSGWNIRSDVVDLVRVFYDVLGGKKQYASMPKEIKTICCGLRRDLVMERFPTAVKLRNHLDTFEWGK